MKLKTFHLTTCPHLTSSCCLSTMSRACDWLVATEG